MLNRSMLIDLLVQPSISFRQERSKESNLHFSEEVYQMRSGFSQTHLYQCSLFALIAHSSPQNLLTCHLIYHEDVKAQFSVTDLKPRARKHKLYRIEAPDQCEHTIQGNQTCIIGPIDHYRFLDGRTLVIDRAWRQRNAHIR